MQLVKSSNKSRSLNEKESRKYIFTFLASVIQEDIPALFIPASPVDQSPKSWIKVMLLPWYMQNVRSSIALQIKPTYK